MGIALEASRVERQEGGIEALPPGTGAEQFGRTLHPGGQCVGQRIDEGRPHLADADRAGVQPDRRLVGQRCADHRQQVLRRPQGLGVDHPAGEPQRTRRAVTEDMQPVDPPGTGERHRDLAQRVAMALQPDDCHRADEAVQQDARIANVGIEEQEFAGPGRHGGPVARSPGLGGPVIPHKRTAERERCVAGHAARTSAPRLSPARRTDTGSLPERLSKDVMSRPPPREPHRGGPGALDMTDSRSTPGRTLPPSAQINFSGSPRNLSIASQSRRNPRNGNRRAGSFRSAPVVLYLIAFEQSRRPYRL